MTRLKEFLGGKMKHMQNDNMESFYAWSYRAAKASFDEGGYHHPNGTKCEAEKAESCPYYQKEKTQVEKEDAVEKASRMQEKLLSLYDEKGVSVELIRACEDFMMGVQEGRVEPKRLPSSIFKMKDAWNKIPKWMAFAYIVGSNCKDRDGKVDKILETFAKASDAYIEGDIRNELKKTYGDIIGDGLESWVYHSDNNQEVIKSTTFDVGGVSTLTKIERLILGNIYFPETAYEPFAIGKDKNGDLNFALKQRKAIFEETPLTQEQIKKWLEARGWILYNAWCGNFVSKGNDLACMDMHEGNVVQTKEGSILCIDPCVYPNLLTLGIKGYYDYRYPPKEMK